MADRIMVPGALPGLLREATDLEVMLIAEVARLTRERDEAADDLRAALSSPGLRRSCLLRHHVCAPLLPRPADCARD